MIKLMGVRIGNSVVVADQQIMRLSIGNVRVRSGARLNIAGVHIGNVVAEEGSTIEVDGWLIGNILNSGCTILIHGSMIGNEVHRRNEPAELAPLTRR